MQDNFKRELNHVEQYYQAKLEEMRAFYHSILHKDQKERVQSFYKEKNFDCLNYSSTRDEFQSNKNFLQTKQFSRSSPKYQSFKKY